MKRERILEIYVPRGYEWVIPRVKELAERELRSVSNVLLRILVKHLKEHEGDSDGEAA